MSASAAPSPFGEIDAGSTARRASVRLTLTLTVVVVWLAPATAVRMTE